VLDASDNKTYEFKFKDRFCLCFRLNSTWLLFNSATDVFPEGLGSSSGELGHNLWTIIIILVFGRNREVSLISRNKVVVPADFIFQDLQILLAIQRKEIS
jgi:hypothetical protein